MSPARGQIVVENLMLKRHELFKNLTCKKPRALAILRSYHSLSLAYNLPCSVIVLDLHLVAILTLHGMDLRLGYIPFLRSRPSTSSTSMATPGNEHMGRPFTSSAISTPVHDRRSRATSTVSSPFFALVPSLPNRPHHQKLCRTPQDFSAFSSKSFKACLSIREVAHVDVWNPTVDYVSFCDVEG
jgi:hypothetical protein